MGCLFTFFSVLLEAQKLLMYNFSTFYLVVLWTSLKSNSLPSFKDTDIRVCYDPSNHSDQKSRSPSSLLSSLVFLNTVFVPTSMFKIFQDLLESPVPNSGPQASWSTSNQHHGIAFPSQQALQFPVSHLWDII